MMIDSGSNFNTIAEQFWKSHFDQLITNGAVCIPMQKGESIKAYAYAQTTPLEILAHIKAPITTTTLSRPTYEAEFMVVAGSQKSLLSKNTALLLNVLRMGGNIAAIESEENKSVTKFPIAPYPEVDLDIDENVNPSRQYFYRIPLALEQKVEQKIREMLEADIIEPVKGQAEWLSGLSVVIKDAKNFRLVLNMKRVNQAIRRPYTIIPTIEDVRHSALGSTVFSKIDLTSAYFHLLLNERSRNMTCFVTRLGTFRYRRLPFGLSSAPEIFQRFMEEVLEGIEGAKAYLDDILMHGKLSSISKRK